MKTKAATGTIATAFFLLGANAWADHHAMDHSGMAGHSMQGQTMETKAATTNNIAEGEVRKLDPAQGKITLRHGPLAHLGMDKGMTMIFRVQDPSKVEALSVGDKVRFSAERVDGALTVTSIEKAE